MSIDFAKFENYGADQVFYIIMGYICLYGDGHFSQNEINFLRKYLIECNTNDSLRQKNSFSNIKFKDSDDKELCADEELLYIINTIKKFKYDNSLNDQKDIEYLLQFLGGILRVKIAAVLKTYNTASTENDYTQFKTRYIDMLKAIYCNQSLNNNTNNMQLINIVDNALKIGDKSELFNNEKAVSAIPKAQSSLGYLPLPIAVCFMVSLTLQLYIPFYT